MTGSIERLLHKIRRFFSLAIRFHTVLQQYRELAKFPAPRFSISWRDRWIHLRDATATTAFDRHYIFHTAWACRVLSEARPSEHVDVGSAVFFISSVSAFVPTRFIDFRPADLGLNGLVTQPGNLLQLPLASDTVQSLSCMHVIEHVGLGRYGDPLDYDGDIKAAHELIRVLSPGGSLLIVVPIGGHARIQFNAHRIYTYQQVLRLFPDLTLVEFALISEDGKQGGLIRHADPDLASAERYGCGCFHFKKAPGTDLPLAESSV